MANNPTYAANWELVSDTITPEYRNKTALMVSINAIIVTVPQRRLVRTKIYEASIIDGANEVPAPAYMAGDNYISANPENLSPVGVGTGKWHLDDIAYSKGLSQPMSRVCRLTWVKYGAWEDYDESEG